ncbi:hypothetical protein DYB32_010785, partial [Aphanomyces invadans]
PRAHGWCGQPDADVMVAGGTEASLTPLSICGFLRAKALATKVTLSRHALVRYTSVLFMGRRSNLTRTGAHAYNLRVSSTKVRVDVRAAARCRVLTKVQGAVGHLLGAAGAVEAIFALKALHENIAPPTLNLTHATAEFDLNYVPQVAQVAPIRAVLTNSFGFGGTNSSLCFAALD